MSMFSRLKKCALAFSLFAAGVSAALASQSQPVTAYVLLSSPGSMVLLQSYAGGSKKINFDRINIAFLKPHLTAWAPNGNLQDLVNAGVITASQLNEDPGFDLKAVVDQLHAKGVKVLISVGGWAYSDCQQADYAACPVGADNFPLSPLVATAATQNPQMAYLPSVQVVDPNFSTEIQNWVNFASTYDLDGLDLDYEESWYAAQYAQQAPTVNHAVSWATPSNGPLIMPQAVEKLAFILNALEADIYNHNKAAAIPLMLTTAAPSVAAYDIHTAVNNGNFYWKPQPGQGGNLKGVYYDLIHAQNHPQVENQDFALYDPAKYSGSLKPLFASFPYLVSGAASANIQDLSGISNIGIMSYDLDDGYDGIGSYWCIGNNEVRDPPDNLGMNVDCSIQAQTKALVTMFAGLYQGVVVAPSKIAFGLEVGFPNYPINLDPSLPGGGNDTADAHYRWNDPWAEYDIPVMSTMGLPNVVSVPGDNYQDIHVEHLLVNALLFQSMQAAGATGGVIVWSVNNSFYNDYLSPDAANLEGDYSLYYLKNNTAHFASDYTLYYQQNAANAWAELGAIFKNAASPDQILDAAYGYYSK